MPTRIRSLLIALVVMTACETAAPGDAPPPAADPRGPSEPRPGAEVRREPGSFPLASAGFTRGDSAAPVTIYEVSDFGCRFCGVFARDEFPVLRAEFVESGRVRWVFIPTEGASPNGARAARAAVCAGEQGRFWEMHDLLFADQRAWMRPRDSDPVLRALALSTGAAAEAFDACYRSEEARARLQRSSRLSLLLGIRATPSFFIDGRIVEGALRAPQFREVIRRAERATAAGSPAETGPHGR